MASSPTPLGLQRPPVPPPDVAMQTGATVMAPFARAAANQAAGAPQQPPVPGAATPAAPVSGGANPAGALLAIGAVMEKLLKQAGQMNETFQPYGDRALAIIQAGIGEASKAVPGASQTPAPDSSVTGDEGQGPTPSGGAGNNFPG